MRHVPLVDHLVWAVPDLAGSCALLESSFGAAVGPGGTHPDHGTENRLLRLGADSYLEILSIDRSAPAGRRSERGERVAAVRAPTLLEVLFRVDDVARLDRADATSELAVTGVFPGVRRRPDGTVVEWRRFELATREGTRLPDAIEWLTPHPSLDLPDAGAELQALRLGAADPGALVAVLAQLGDPRGIDVVSGMGLEADLVFAKGDLTLRSDSEASI
jgi:hypothetical protein